MVEEIKIKGEVFEKMVRRFKADLKKYCGDVKLVGVKFYFLNEENDILSTPAFFSKDFNPKDYEE